MAVNTTVKLSVECRDMFKEMAEEKGQNMKVFLERLARKEYRVWKERGEANED